jgi:hypothetical protein
MTNFNGIGSDEKENFANSSMPCLSIRNAQPYYCLVPDVSEQGSTQLPSD